MPNSVPRTYFDFIMSYAPYFYYLPDSGTVDPDWSRGPAPAAFAIEFLHEAYSVKEFETEKTSINNKIVALADYLLSIQCNDNLKLAYGGFKSKDDSTYYYSIDAARAIPALLKAYNLTGTVAYHDAAKLAGSTFLHNMQHKPSQLGIHDKYYGGFAKAVTINDAWLAEMDVESLYGFIGLKMLVDYDADNKTKYETMLSEAIVFLRSGFENLWLEYRPLPSGDGQWHRVGLNENEIYDDPFAYALIGLYDYEGWSLTVQKVYNFINTIRANAQYPGYNPAVCWAGYIDVVSRFPACDYYDAVTAGILWKIRKNHDKPSLQFSMKIIEKHPNEFMFWGVKHADYGYVENKKAMVTVCWLSLLHLKYEDPLTRFTQILKSKGENIILYPVREAFDKISYGEGIEIQAIVSPAKADEVLIESGYIIDDYVTIHVFAPIRYHDKIRRKGVDYEVLDIQEFDFQGEPLYRKAICRRLLGA